MTLNEIAVQLAVPLGRQFDQPFLAMIKDLVVVWTGRLLRNTLEKNEADRMFFRTPPLYLPLHQDTANCGGGDCPVMVTDNIPTPLRANNILFDFVGSQDGSTAFKQVFDGFEVYQKANKYTGKNIAWRWSGRRIEVLANGRPAVIKVVGIWEDPRKLATSLCGSNVPACSPDDYEYQVNNDILQLVLQYVNSESLKEYRPQSQESEVNIDHDAAVPSNRGN